MKQIVIVASGLLLTNQAHAIYMVCGKDEQNTKIKVVAADNCSVGLAADLVEKNESYCLSKESEALEQLQKELREGTAPQAYQACASMTGDGYKVSRAIDARLR